MSKIFKTVKKNEFADICTGRGKRFVFCLAYDASRCTGSETLVVLSLATFFDSNAKIIRVGHFV
jgi:hypothetical protein